MAAFTIRGKNIEITPALKEYVEKRVGKVTKYFDKVGEISVLLTVVKGRHIVEVTVPLQGGVLLRGQEATMDMYSSIDLVVEKLERQIHKQKTKLARRFREGGFKAEMIMPEPGAKAVAVDEYLNGKNGGFKALASKYGLHPSSMQPGVHLYEIGGTEALFKTPESYSGEFKVHVVEYMYQHSLSAKKAAAGETGGRRHELI